LVTLALWAEELVNGDWNKELFGTVKTGETGEEA
jgi:hypothetical protein